MSFEVNSIEDNNKKKKYSERELSFLLAGNDKQELMISVNFTETFLTKAWEALENDLDLSEDLFKELEENIKLVFKKGEVTKEKKL